MKALLKSRLFTRQTLKDPKGENKPTVFNRERLKMKAKKPLKKKFSDFFKSLDIYGKQVQLSYNGDSYYKTKIGATISFMLISLLLLYTANLLRVLQLRSQTDISTGRQVLDLDLQEPFRPQDLGFDFAFAITKDLEPKYGYFTARRFQYVYLDQLDEDGMNKRVVLQEDLNFTKCGENLFNFENQTAVQLYGIQNYYCLTDKNYSLAGDYYSYYFSFLEITVRKCKNGTSNVTCAPTQEIDQFFEGTIFNFAFVNTIFNLFDFEDSLQYYIDDQAFYYMEADRLKSTNLYVMSSNAELEDSLIQFGQEAELTYYQVQSMREYDKKIDEKGKLIEIYIRFDKNSDTIQRKVFGWLELLGDVGGLYSILYIAGVLMVSFFQVRLFNSAIIKDIYQVRKKQPKTEQIKTPKAAEQRDRRNSFNFTNRSRNGETGKDQTTQCLNRVMPTTQTNGNDFESPDNLVSPIQMIRKLNTTNQNNDQQLQISTAMRRQAIKVENLNDSFVAATPSQRLQKIQQKLKSVDQLKSNNVNSITSEIIQRERFRYTSWHILKYFCQCLCLRELNKKKNNPRVKPHFFYEKGKNKLMKELDVVNLLKTLRNMKLISQAILSQRHRMLLRFQRQHLIESESTSSADSDDNKQNILKLMEHKNPVVRLMIYGKIKRMMVWFLSNKLDKEDKNLLRGIFKKKIKDFDEDYTAKHQGTSLQQRLKNEIIQFAQESSSSDSSENNSSIASQQSNFRGCQVEIGKLENYYEDRQRNSLQQLQFQNFSDHLKTGILQMMKHNSQSIFSQSAAGDNNEVQVEDQKFEKQNTNFICLEDAVEENQESDVVKCDQFYFHKQRTLSLKSKRSASEGNISEKIEIVDPKVRSRRKRRKEFKKSIEMLES